MQAHVDPSRLRYFRRRLRRWFRAHGRDLPWRRTRDPYRILLSEIMLQQTQVPRVAEVYERFLAAYPRLEDVAAAPLGDVRRITDPLGYTVRGRHIKRIAEEVVRYRDGRVPDTLPDLLALPGVGRSTAGAVLTFAYGRPTPILDTNVERVLGRWFAGVLPAGEAAGRRRRLWALAAAMLPRRGDGWEINQALMDFGAQVCRARRPRCDVCPLRRRCHAVRPRAAAAERGLVTWSEAGPPRSAAAGGSRTRSRRANGAGGTSRPRR